jgi:hypothetical protein
MNFRVLHRIVGFVCMAGEPARELKNRIEGKANQDQAIYFISIIYKEEWKLKHFLL